MRFIATENVKLTTMIVITSMSMALNLCFGYALGTRPKQIPQEPTVEDAAIEIALTALIEEVKK